MSLLELKMELCLEF